LESLIIIIIFLLVSSLGGGKKRKANSGRNRPQGSGEQRGQPVTMRDLARQARQLISEVQQENSPRRQSDRRAASRRAGSRTDESECGYCTGEIEVGPSLPHHAGTTSVAVLPNAEPPSVDVAALQKQWGVSDLQNALLWQEILDKPLALRRRGSR